MMNIHGSNAGPCRWSVLKLAGGAALASGVLGIRQLTRGSLTKE